MIPVLSVALMRASDAQTIESGTPSRELMRRAGEGIVDAVDRYPSERGSWRPPVAVVCGSGNNAGDGYVVAGILCRRGIACTVFLLLALDLRFGLLTVIRFIPVTHRIRGKRSKR